MADDAPFTVAQARSVFKSFDCDGDGTITAAELAHVLLSAQFRRAMPLGLSTADLDVDKMVDFFSPDSAVAGANKVTYEQFVRIVTREDDSATARMWRAALRTELELTASAEDAYAMFLLEKLPDRTATRRRYDPATRQWSTDRVVVKLEYSVDGSIKPFAAGAVRRCPRSTGPQSHGRATADPGGPPRPVDARMLQNEEAELAPHRGRA